jgi:hypothetical protein
MTEQKTETVSPSAISTEMQKEVSSKTETKDKETHVSDVKPARCEACDKVCTTRCKDCKQVYYCSRVCQKVHWRIHKKVCAVVDEESKSSGEEVVVEFVDE